MSNNTDKLAAYVSSLALQRIENTELKKNLPDMVRFPAAVLFVDISGFTTFTEEMDTSGPEGIEMLADLLNSVFSRLISVVYENGGDVVKFAGDALWAIWRGGDSLDEAVHRSIYCAKKIQEDYSIHDDTTVNLRVSLSAGQISVLHVGGEYNRWEMIIAGQPLLELGKADRNAKPGDVYFSGKIPSSLNEFVEAAPAEEGCFRIDSVSGPVKDCMKNIKSELKMTDALRGYIPGAILKRLDAGQEGWLSEIRKVTVVFIRVKGLDYEKDNCLETAHTFMRNLQKIIYYHEGSLNRLNVDDKGTIMLAAFGLPPLSHDNDPERALNAMWEIQDMLKTSDLKVSIGITTGRAFCGALGNEYRREYTMHGDMVNLSARLMQKASEGWGILCDETTFRDVRSSFQFQKLSNVPLKGRKALANLYSPGSLLKKNDVRVQSLNCRQSESEIVSRKIDLLRKKYEGGVIVIEGDSGIGKTTFIKTILSSVDDSRLKTVFISGNTATQNSNFASIKKIMKRYLHALEDRSANQFSDHLTKYRSLLNTKNKSLFPETEESQLLTPSLKMDTMKDLFAEIFQNMFSNDPVLFVADEAQWIDPMTWRFFEDVSRKKSDLLLVILTRPIYDSAKVPSIMQQKDNIRIILGPFSVEQILQVVYHRLGTKCLSGNLEKFLVDHAQGHPFYASKLAGSLSDNNLLYKNDDGCLDLKGEFNSESDYDIFSPIFGLITEKIDKLSPVDQLVLKVASVLGKEIPLKSILEIYPFEIDRESLRKSLTELVRRDFLILNSVNDDHVYSFKRNLVQIVANNMLLFSQKIDLMRKLDSLKL